MNVILSKFPNHTWLGVRQNAFEHQYVPFESICHMLWTVLSGRRQVRIVGFEEDKNWEESEGSVCFLPADRKNHTLVNKSSGCSTFTIFIPAGQLEGVLRPFMGKHDALLSCLKNFLKDEPNLDRVARNMIRQIRQMNGIGQEPNWNDQAVFDQENMSLVVSKIDRNLTDPPPYAEFAQILGLSLNHFHRKLKRSVGLSPHRFINYRRLRKVFGLDISESIANIATDIGFCSQSHFTKVFTQVTGFTPARFRKFFSGDNRHEG